jgi:lipopolysaccharide export system protein LptC
MTADGDAPRSGADILWQPRQVSVEGSVTQYSRFVQRMKIALPVAAGVILLLVLLLPQFRSESERFRIGLKSVGTVTTDSLSMVNARYFGTDDQGAPFSIDAQAVRERPTPDKLIDLTEPRAALSAKSGRRLNVSASTGVYDRNQEILELGGKVSLADDQGYEFHTSALRVFLRENRAAGDAPVTGRGPNADIAAAGFSARQNDNAILFTGPATLVFRGGDTGAPPATAETPR